MICETCGGQVRSGASVCGSCGLLTLATDDALLGTVLADKFRIDAQLGEGGMGRVYRAAHLTLGVDVAIKTLRPTLVREREVVQRFFREARAASLLRHPNSVTILDFGDAAGTLYIAMELVRGRSLAAVLAEERLIAPKRAIRIVGQVLDALAAAHALGVIHRDLKPENIMLEDLASRPDFAKVLDFGLAKITTGPDDKLSRPDLAVGTPAYMAPEQATTGIVDARTDVYAAGVVLFELLTGELPFSAPTLPALLVEVANTPAPPLASKRPDLHADLAAIVDACLAKDPAERPATALELKAALEAIDFAKPAGQRAVRRAVLPDALADDLAHLRRKEAGEARDIVVLAVDGTADTAEMARRHGGLAESSMLVFGVTTRHADSAERAVEAALASATGTRAIHIGRAMVVGASYTPEGDTVALPVWLAASAPRGKVIVTEAVRAAVQVRFELRALKVSDKTVYEVVGPRRAAMLARPAFVGRDDGVRAMVDAVRGGTPAILVAGEPGIGKSRLLEELAGRLAGRAIATTARPGSDRRSPMVPQLAAALQLEQELDLAHLTDDQRHAMIGGAVRRSLAARAPVCVIADDVHLADPLAAAVLASLVTAPIAGVALIAGARSGYALPWEGAIRTATLAPLDDAAIARIAMAALGHDEREASDDVDVSPGIPRPVDRHATGPARTVPSSVPTAIVDAVVARAGGSPLIALELLQAWFDGGQLVRDGERWRIAGELGATPVSAAAMYAARFDTLPADTQTVLAIVAVAGGSAPRSLVATGLGRAPDSEIAALVQRGFIHAGDPIRFVQPSARDAIYAHLTRDARRRIHRAIAAVLDGNAPHDVVGMHYELGGDATRALINLDRATDAAIAARALRRAADVLRRVCGIARAAQPKRLPADATRLADLLVDIGELGDARDAASEALAAARADDDALAIARARRVRGRVLVLAGDLDGGTTDFEAATATAIALRDDRLVAELHADLGEAREKRGDLAGATRALLDALDRTETLTGDTRALALRVLLALGRVLVRERDLDRAERFLAQARGLAVAEPVVLAKVIGNLAGVAHARGDLATATQLATESLELSRGAGDLIGMARQLINLGALAVDRDTARRYYDAAYAEAERAGWREGMATAAAALTRAGTPAR